MLHLTSVNLFLLWMLYLFSWLLNLSTKLELIILTMSVKLKVLPRLLLAQLIRHQNGTNFQRHDDWLCVDNNARSDVTSCKKKFLLRFMAYLIYKEGLVIKSNSYTVSIWSLSLSIEQHLAHIPGYKCPKV